MAMAEIKRRSWSLPELSSPPPWFEFSFLLDFAEGADMVRGSTVTPLGPGCLSVRGSNSFEEFPPKVPSFSFTWTACCSSVSQGLEQQQQQQTLGGIARLFLSETLPLAFYCTTLPPSGRSAASQPAKEVR